MRAFLFWRQILKGLDTLAKLFTVKPKVNYLPCFVSKGIQFAARYLRNLDPVEVKAICDAGLQIVSCAERGHPDVGSYFTKARGIADGNWAVKLARGLNQPVPSAIYFTVDYGCPVKDHPAVIEYFRGVNQALAETGYKVGGYAPGAVLTKLLAQNLIRHTWLPNARSWRPGFSGTPNIDQRAQTTFCGVSVDPDESFGDFGAWGQGEAVNVAPAARVLKRGDKGDEVKTLQSTLVTLGLLTSADGVFGPATENAVKTFQSKNELTADGIAGPATRKALNL